MQLNSLQKACDDLKIENDALKAKVEQQNFNLQGALNEQKEAFASQVDYLQAQLSNEIQQK